MKKLTSFFSLLTLCSIAYAQQPANITQTNQPALLLDAYDLSDPKNPKALPNKTISRSNPNHHLCWTAINVNTRNANITIEQFSSPVSTRFTDINGIEAQRDKEGKLHTLLSYVGVLENKFVEKCWKFSSKYPLGQYTFAAQINDIEFPAQKFTIGK